jgi:hypothetical protein
MAFQSYNMPSEFDIGDVDETMFHDVERPFESIFYNLGLRKSLLDCGGSGVLSRRMALRAHKLTSKILKKNFDEVDETMFQTSRKAIRTNFPHPEQRKKRLGRGRLSDVLSRRMAFRTRNLPSGHLW